MKLVKAILLYIMTSLLATENGVAVVDSYEFPTPERVREQVTFWHKIFSKYETHESIIHDRALPNAILDVIDFKAFAAYYNQGAPYTTEERQKIRDKYIRRYSLAIRRFKAQGKSAVEYGPMEARVLKVYSRSSEGLSRLFKESIDLRAQKGLADEFHRAAIRSRRYLPYIEDIFRSYSLPVDLTRLPFVESMFNEHAVSKVGASGIWQFMPATARQFIKVTKFIDERNSPIKASYAAAKFMKSNYKALGSWPLAITAYNHGTYGIKRAVKRMRTIDLGEIIENYQHRSFGFASRNFYAEFLAANYVYKNKYKPSYRQNNPMNIVKIKLKKRTSISELIRLTSLDDKTLKKYNLCLRESAFERYRNNLLPRNFELLIPSHLASKIENNMNTIAQISTENRYSL